MDFILVLFVCLAFSYFISWLFSRIGLPSIIGHLTTGLIISIPQIRNLIFTDATSINLFSSLGNLGLIFLLFFIGLKINVHKLVKFSKRSVHVAILSVVIPFVLGYIFGKMIGMSNVSCIVLGTCLSITAEAVTGAILDEMKKFNSKIGTIIIEAGIFDDIFEILTLATIGALIQAGDAGKMAGIEKIVMDIVVFVIIIYAVRFIFIPFTFKMLGKKPSHAQLFSTSFLIVLLMAAIANYLEFGIVIGALIAGVIVKQTLIKEHKIKEEHEVVDLMHTITFGFLEPIFFIWIAFEADIFTILATETSDFFIIAITITLIATAGKLLGPIISNVLIEKRSLKEGITIGWGLNARGAVELIAVKMAWDAGLIEPLIYSSIFFMTFVTTIISPIIFKYLMKNMESEKKKKAVSV